MVGPCTIESPLRTLEKMEDVFQAWWNAWYNEKLADFIAKPPKFNRSGPAIQVGDIVVFQKDGGAKARHSHLVGRSRHPNGAWTINDLIREVVVEYKNASEKVFRTTRCTARSVAILFKEEDLDLTQKLSAASRKATKALLMRTPVAAPAPTEADGWSQYAMSLEWLKGYCQQAGDPNAVCCIANIHVDPWDDIPIEVTKLSILTVEAPCSSDIEWEADP
jgi:hypothetical protein